MFRRNLVSTHRRISCSSRAKFSTVIPSLVGSQDTLSLTARNPNPPLLQNSPESLTPFQNSVGRCNSSLALDSVSPYSEIYDSLVRRYQLSYCHEDSEQLHLQVIKNGFACDLFLVNTLINVYTRTGDLDSARNLFDEMPVKNSVTWSCLISGYTRNEMPFEACAAFRKMIRAGFSPVHYAIGSALRASQALESCGLSFGLQVHGLVSKSLNAFSVVVYNVLISMYGNCTDSTSNCAWRVFDEMKVKDLVSWNSIISVYSQRGDAVNAFKLFSRMQVDSYPGSSFRPTEYTFGSLISSAASFLECGSSLLDQVLANINKYGFVDDLYVGSALVSGFARSGKIRIAKKIFEMMSVRNVVSMHGLMIGLTRQKRGEEAIEVFLEMKDLVHPNSDTYPILLTTIAEFSLVKEGRLRGKEVHAFVIRTGLSDSKVTVGNSLINMYAKCGSVSDAWSVFQLMINNDEVSWNTMISGLDQNGYFSDAIMLFSTMRRNGLVPANFTLISALSSCAGLGWLRMGEQIHCEGVKLGLDTDISVSNALLGLYAEAGCINVCEKVFSIMPEYDQVSWNSIIGAFSGSEAVEYFISMMRGGWNPNLVTFVNILGAASSLSFGGLAQQIHGLTLKHQITDDTAIGNAILLCYGKCGQMNDCEKVFTRMGERRDDVSWNSMISGYIHSELLNKAMEMVWFMLQSGQKLDSFTFATVLSACASVATLERGMEVHACGTRACLDSDVVVGTALIDTYSKSGRIDYASSVFSLMPVKNIYSWNSMICGYARHGQGEKSLELFAKMKLEGQLPDHVTFVGVLSACSHVGLVEQGLEHFNSMWKLYGLRPKMEHFSCMVDVFARAGKLGEIEDFIDKMPMRPNALIWRTVLGACSRASGPKADCLGNRAGEMLLELEPENAVNYVLLSNMYASGEKWDDVAKARVKMRSVAVKKEAGYSWVTMKDGVHVFVASDTSHPDKIAIYEKLKELQGKMKEMGYVPETKFALRDLDIENKEELLSYHSEKLAVAFVLTRKTSELPIRIMKNLRVCGDCHTALKYMSKIAGRLIVVRDSNRFHHFADGKCSCGDYW